MKFADITNDIAFRKVLGNESRKESLISFLNAILQLEKDNKIKKVNILNPYQLPNLRGGKVTIVDVKATDQKGRSFIVEMQVAEADGFHKRVLYYASKSYSDQIKRGDFYRNLRPVFFIAIVNFELTQNKNYISRNQVRDIETGEQTIKDVEFTFIELPKFNKTEKELETLTDKWVYFIKNAENLEVVPPHTRDKGLKSAYEEANQYTWSQQELDAYDYVFMREEDERARWDKALEKATELGLEQGQKQGLEQGLEQGQKQGLEQGRKLGIELGIEQGALKAKKEMIAGFQKIGVSNAKIAEAMGISEDEIERILSVLEEPAIVYQKNRKKSKNKANR